MEPSIFTKIINREIPAEILFEDEDTIAILDIAPSSPGHTLVIPKKPVRNVLETDEATWLSVMKTVRKIAPGVRKAVDADGLNIHSNNEAAAGQVVFHMHIHLIPRFKDDGLKMFAHTSYEEGEAARVAEKIRTAISG